MNRRDFLTGLGAIPLLAFSPALVDGREPRQPRPTNSPFKYKIVSWEDFVALFGWRDENGNYPLPDPQLTQWQISNFRAGNYYYVYSKDTFGHGTFKTAECVRRMLS